MRLAGRKVGYYIRLRQKNKLRILVDRQIPEIRQPSVPAHLGTAGY